ncbi:CRAL/TRIO domain-containing protein [Lindgomyces ingoldianus]|uniref:CRAL/TRIO domain-containing protein n=1 Tax=Lindgomyces ingoldianus TaxID=673940 RepID=A0ACB6R421_9PLEO|nr:CRAL/TRIO domain-containing protein [Lindgomyces ingoldianus]KAF2473262.1 CRAL/TRIO domain-containing protein [Lindgomyces ingoldianus]
MSSEPGKPSTGMPTIATGPAGEDAAEFLEKQAAKQQEASMATAETAHQKEEPPIAEKTIEEPSAAGSKAVEKSEQPVSAPEETKAEEQTAPTGTTTSSSSSGPAWPETDANHPLTQFFASVEELTKTADYNEVYGITLSPASPFQTKLILQKFLRANSNDLVKAKEQLLETLKWRKEFDPVKAMSESYEKERFEGLGYIVDVDGVPESVNSKDTVTFNIYGSVKDNKKTFGDLDGFLRWRVGLMERSVHKLGLPTADKPIPDFGEGLDPYQGFQVHDYLQVSFIRMDPNAKAASKKTIETFQKYYPETLSRKFFVNVPVVMGWLFAAMKLFVAKETIKKFTVLSYGTDLVGELGKGIPSEYGGEKGLLKDVGEGVVLREGEQREIGDKYKDG